MNISSLSSANPYANTSYLMSRLSSSDKADASEKFQNFSGVGTSGTGTTTGIGRTSMDDSTLQALFQGVSGRASAQQPDFANMVSAMDADSDGTVTQEEFVSAKPSDVTEEMAENLWSQFDTEGTGSLSVEELSTAMAENKPSPSGGTSQLASAEEETYSALQDLIDQLNETTSTTETTTETSSSSLTALQEFLSAIKSYQASAGYENTQNLMSSLMAMA